MDDIKTLASALRGVLSHANKRGDFFWRKADRMLDGFDALAEAHQAEVARLTRENEGLAKDAARLDYLQQGGATVEFLPGGHGGYFFRIGGLRRAVHADIRIAIDAALAGASGAAGEGAEQ
jgi:hypothetical protein